MSKRRYSLFALFYLAVAGQIFSLQPGKKYNFRFKDGQHLRNAILLEETETGFRVRLEYLSDEKILEKKDLKELPVLAHSLVLTPDTEIPLPRLETLAITFAEPTLGAENPANYELSGGALGTLKIASVRQTGKFRYELRFSGQAADGNLVIKIRKITDNVGAPLINDSIEYTLDATKPRFEASPASDSAIRSLDEILLRFSEEVSGAGNAENYRISGPGMGGVSLTKIVQDSAAANSYRLIFKGKCGNGNVKLRLKNMTDRAGNPLESEQITYTADTINPTLAVSPAQKTLLRELNKIELVFSEAVSGADRRENYVISGTGAGDLRVQEIHRTENGQYRVQFSGSAANGSVSIQVANVTDTAGNSLEQNAFVYGTDIQSPEVRATPAPGTAIARLKTVEIEFSEAVIGAEDMRNYILSGAGVGSLNSQKIQKISNTRYALHLAGAPSNGDILLQLKNIADAAGNTLRNDSLQYRADTTPPVYKPSILPGSVVNSIQDIDLVFSEPVVDADKRENYRVTGSGANNLRIASVVLLKDNTYRISFTGALENGEVLLQIKNISDQAGNPLPTRSLEYLADVTKPELQKISPTAGTTLRNLSEIELQFSEPVTGADNAQNYALSGEGLGSLGIASATALSGDRVRLALTGKPGEGKVSLRCNNITDRAQNTLTAQAINFRLDNGNPVFQADLPAGIVIAAVETVSIRFSEAVSGAANAENYVVSGPGAGSLRARSVRVEKNGTYIIQFAGKPVDGDVTLSITNVTDLAGNPLQDNRLTFRADETPPTFVFSPPGENPLSRLDQIRLNFSEPVVGADRVENYALAGEGVGELKIASAETIAENAFRVSLTGKPGNGKITVQLRNVTDAAGNKPQNEILAYRADTIPPTFEATPKTGTLANEFSAVKISYSKPVIGGAELKNYVLAGEGIGTLKIERITALSTTDYRIVLNGAPSSGAIHLSIANVTDLAGNILAPNQVVYQSDTVNPTIIVSPQPEAPLNSLPTVNLRFSKPVFGADNPANYRLTGTGVGSLRLEKVVKKDNEYLLAFSGTAAQGEVTLTMHKILDAAGNAPATTSLQYQIDLKPVEVRARPVNKSKLEALPEIELTFSKEVPGAEIIDNYSIAGENTELFKLTVIERRGNNTYRLQFSGEVAGAIQILIKNIRDPAGNDLKNNRLDYTIEIPTTSQPSGDVVR